MPGRLAAACAPSCGRAARDIGVLIGRLPATRRWEPADQDLLELFANAMAAAIRNAQLFATGRDPEPAAARARRGQGRLPARREPQPPDAAHEHPGLRRAARRGRARPSARDHRRAVRAAVADGPPAADRDAPGVGRAQAAQRGRVAGDARAQGVGGAGRRRRRLRARGRGRAAGWPSRTRISSTRSCGPCSTTRSSTVPAPRSGPTIAVDDADRPGPADDRGPAGRASPRPIGTGCSRASRAAARRRPTAGADWASTCRASCAGRWAGTWSSSRPTAGRGAAFTIVLPGEPGDEG